MIRADGNAVISEVSEHQETPVNPQPKSGGQEVAGSNPVSPTQAFHGVLAAEVALVKGLEA